MKTAMAVKFDEQNKLMIICLKVLAKPVPAAAGIQVGRALFLFERCKRHVGVLSNNC